MKHVKNRHKLIIPSILLLWLLASSVIVTVSFGVDVHAAECGGVTTSVVGCSENDGNAIWSLLLIVVNVMAGLVGAAAIGGFIYGAILYSSAGDKASQVTKAKETFANVVLGLALFALMWAFIQFLIPGGVFDRDYSAPKVSNTPTARTDSGKKGGSGGNSGGSDSGAAATTSTDLKLANFRDASAATNGNVLKSGVLYRSVQLYDIRNNPKKLEKIGTLLGSKGTIVDLRLKPAVDKAPDPTIPGVKNRNIPIGGKYETSEFVDKGDMNQQFGKTLKLLANAPGPVWIHCVSGKDRTGWTVAMIMYAVGANDKQVKKEYAESTKYFDGKDGKQYHDPNWINSGVALAKKNYGSIQGYLKKGLGLTDDDIAKLKSKFGA